MSAGALLWRKVVAPLDRMLQLSEELNHPDWIANKVAEHGGNPNTIDSMTSSLVQLSNAVKPPSAQVSADTATPARTETPVA